MNDISYPLKDVKRTAVYDPMTELQKRSAPGVWLSGQRDAAKSASMAAYLQLKEQIVSLAIPPGTVVNETAVARQLGLGRTPVREALQRLVMQGAVVFLPRRGVLVTDVSLTDFQYLYEARLPLEEQCARLACERLSDALLLEGTSLLRALEDAQREGDRKAWIVLEGEFHHFVARASGNPHLVEISDRLHLLTVRLWNFVWWRGAWSREEFPLFSPREVFDAIRARDPQRAGEAMRAHVWQSREALARYLLEPAQTR